MDWREAKNNPTAKERLISRGRILQSTRDFFQKRGFLELDTPLLVRCAGSEPNLNPLKVSLTDEQNREHHGYLITSPEYSLKKFLAAGFPKIFQLGKCFRNNEPWGFNHNPEFTMLEWYETKLDYQGLMKTTEDLFLALARTTSINYRGQTINLATPWPRLSMIEAWQLYSGVDLNRFLTYNEISWLAEQKGYRVKGDDTYDDIFFKIFLSEIEPKIANGPQPVFLYDYPSQMAALSKIKAADPRYAERFELYCGGMELANAYTELIDTKEQRRRFEEDVKKRKEFGKPDIPIDEELLSALSSGLPPCAGIALGMDRLIMLLTNDSDIEEVIPLSANNLFKKR